MEGGEEGEFRGRGGTWRNKSGYTETSARRHSFFQYPVDFLIVTKELESQAPNLLLSGHEEKKKKKEKIKRKTQGKPNFPPPL